VETEDVLLVAHKGDSQKIAELTQKLAAEQRTEIRQNIIAYKPWGQHTVIADGENFRVKKVIVEPGRSMPLHMHYHRNEYWAITEGSGSLVLDDKEIILYKDQSIFVPRGSKHKVSNPGLVPLEIVEVQTGEYLGDDDVVYF
jgi:mannose-1-phosphate guanylyltransferase/mannose-6-phosphate isomerase